MPASGKRSGITEGGQHMKRVFAILIALCLFASFAGAEGAPGPALPASEELVVLHHSAAIQGRELNYTTTTGLMTVDTAGGACEMFFMAYTLDGVEDLAKRPVTFAFNGGPGSSSEWVQLGFLAPRRIAVDEDGQAASIPVAIEDNEYSILDLTDLVFIDPVGTGYSAPAEGVDLKEFMGYDNDLRSVGAFIRLYTSRYGRWGSPKYVAGESYGTTRAVGLAKYLSDTYAMDLNGIMLISCINNMTTLMDNENPGDLAYALYLPTYAADAWYHKKLDGEYQQKTLEELTAEARAFAGGEYLSALFKGRTLGEEERNAVAERLAAFTGLKAEIYLENNLRLKYTDFCQSLLSDEKLVIGRIDGRYTGPLTGGDMGSGDADPSVAALGGVMSAAVNRYISEELGYQADWPYVTLDNNVFNMWSFPDNFGGGFSQEKILYETLSKNKFLKVWVLCGYYDLATPFFNAEWCFNHVFVNSDREANIQFTYYPSGHMIYMHGDSLARFRKEAEEWYK